MDLLDTLREDIIDGLASVDAAEAALAFEIQRQPDGSLTAKFDESAFVVRIERVE